MRHFAKSTNLPMFRQRCIDQYTDILKMNPRIDAGHSINHVLIVEKHAREALNEWVGTGKETVPTDVRLRMEMACLLHEVGDHKFGDTGESKDAVQGEILDKVLYDYPEYGQAMKQDIIRMIDYCSASKWGDVTPPGCQTYQLIPRWADRLEATGIIGLVRCLTYTYSKRDSGQVLCSETDDFPTTLDELEMIAPYERFELYGKGISSTSAFGHLMDKIRHIDGSRVLVRGLAQKLNNEQKIIDRFIIDYTVNDDKRFDIGWLLSQLDQTVYATETMQLKELQCVLRSENCKWIK
jgi:HD superfamily phosphodiesterase